MHPGAFIAMLAGAFTAECTRTIGGRPWQTPSKQTPLDGGDSAHQLAFSKASRVHPAMLSSRMHPGAFIAMLAGAPAMNAPCTPNAVEALFKGKGKGSLSIVNHIKRWLMQIYIELLIRDTALLL